MDEFVGRIEWEGVELATGVTEGEVALILLEDVVIERRRITKGEQALTERFAKHRERPPTHEDVAKTWDEIQRDPTSSEIAAIWFLKSIQLSPSYHVGYAEHPVKDRLMGFGFSTGRGPIVTREQGCGLTFSWDWFNVTAAGRAEKLQESGVISFERKEFEHGYEITRMLFESDVSFRIVSRGKADVLSPDWRIRISQGSEIVWPSLVDGLPLPNGVVKGPV